MAVPSGTTQTYQAIGRREDLANDIYNLSPTKTPFLSSVGRGKATNTFHEWQTDALAAASGTNAVVEGTDATNNTLDPTVRLGNYTQLSEKTVQVSSSQRAANNAGRGDEFTYQLVKRSKELKRDMETTLTGNYASVAGNASTARKCAGFEAWIQTNASRGSGGSSTAFSGGIQAAATDGTQRAFVESYLKDVLDLAVTNGGEPDRVLVGPFNKRTMSGFNGIADAIRDTGNKRATIIGAAEVYVGDYHELQLIPSLFSRLRSALVVDPQQWEVCYYQNFQQADLAKTGHADRRMLFVEYTLQCNNELGSGIVADLTTS